MEFRNLRKPHNLKLNEFVILVQIFKLQVLQVFGMNWVNRWFNSTNAKDIGTLYILFGAFSGQIGSAQSQIIRMEQSSGGKVYQMGSNDDYNVIITGHGIVMIFFMVMPIQIGGFGKYIMQSKDRSEIEENNLNMLDVTQQKRQGSYLAGLIEGDGTIIVPDPSIMNRQPQIRISFNEKDIPQAKIQINKIGYGRISIPKEGKYVLQHISEYAGLYKVIQQVNGYFRTPKQEAQNRQINWINVRSLIYLRRYGNYPKQKEQKGQDFTPIEKNNWFAGFVDADGNFNTIIAPRTNTNNIRIQTQFRIEQRQTYHRSIIDEGYGTNYFDIQSKIANHLGVNVYSRSRFQNQSITYQYYFVAGSIRSKKILRSYFGMFPQYSSKYQDYKDWCKIIDIANPDEGYTNISIEKKKK